MRQSILLQGDLEFRYRTHGLERSVHVTRITQIHKTDGHGKLFERISMRGEINLRAELTASAKAVSSMSVHKSVS